MIPDPQTLVADINAGAFPLYVGHDPGVPRGSVLAAKLFTSETTAFVAGVIGLYSQERVSRFQDLGVEPSPVASSPSQLEELGEKCWIDLAIDSRELAASWLEDVCREAPLPVKRTDLLHNAADPAGELIRVGLVYAALVWNPFVTSIATEAGKHAYTALHKWIGTLWESLGDCRNPIIEIQSHQNGCQVSFLFRGSGVQKNYAAHGALPLAAAQAAMLISGMIGRGHHPARLVYEFAQHDAKWFPSYAVLNDGRLISELSRALFTHRPRSDEARPPISRLLDYYPASNCLSVQNATHLGMPQRLRALHAGTGLL